MTAPATTDWSSLLGVRTKDLDRTRFGYKLVGGASPFGMDVMFADQLDMDESRMSLWIPYADGRRRDGVGDLLEVGGIDTERHRKLPNVLFDHGKSVSLPIAMARDPETFEYTNVIDPAAKSAKLNAFFYSGKSGALKGVSREREYDHALFCEQLYDMAAKRFLGAGSIGYQVKQAVQLPPDYHTGTPQGLHLLQVLMLEGSLVVMPANQDTVRKMLCINRCCGKSLSPYLIKSLQPYSGEKVAQLGYEKRNGGVSRLTSPLTVPNPTLPHQTQPGHSLPGHTVPHGGASVEGKAVIGKTGAKGYSEKKSTPVRHGDMSKTDVPPPHSSQRWLDGESSPGGPVPPRKPGAKTKQAMRPEEAKYRSLMAADSPLGNGAKTMDDRQLRTGLLSQGVGAMKTLNGKQALRLDDKTWLIDGSKKDLGGAVLAMVASTGTKAGPRRCNCGGRGPCKCGKALPSGSNKNSTPKLGAKMAKQIQARGKALPPDDMPPGAGGPDASAGPDAGLPPEGDLGVGPEGMGEEGPGDDIVPPAGDEGPGGENPEDIEKYSAQVLRRMHADARALLKEYHDMRGLLEHPEVDGHLEKKLQGLVTELDEIEALFDTHHPESEPLEGAEERPDIGLGGEGGTPGTEGEEFPEEEGAEGEEGGETPEDVETEEEETPEADSGESDEPPAGEAVEGMEEDAEKKGEKGLRDYYRKGMYRHGKGKQAFREINKATRNANVCKRGKDLGVEGSHAPGGGAHDQALQAHEGDKVGEAAGFLKELSEEHNFHKEHQMKAYHYHKALEPMGAAPEQPEGTPPPAAGPGGVGMKNFALHQEDGMWFIKGLNAKAGFRDGPYNEEFSASRALESLAKAFPEMDEAAGDVDVTKKKSCFPEMDAAVREMEVTKKKGVFPEMDEAVYDMDVTKKGLGGGPEVDVIEAEAAPDLTAGSGAPPWRTHRQSIGKASQFFKALSQLEPTRYGDEHRMEAFNHCQMLEPVAKAVKEANVQHPESNPQASPTGEVDVGPTPGEGEFSPTGEVGEKGVKGAKKPKVGTKSLAPNTAEQKALLEQLEAREGKILELTKTLNRLRAVV